MSRKGEGAVNGAAKYGHYILFLTYTAEYDDVRSQKKVTFDLSDGLNTTSPLFKDSRAKMAANSQNIRQFYDMIHVKCGSITWKQNGGTATTWTSSRKLGHGNSGTVLSCCQR